jgi:hypothetical protein
MTSARPAETPAPTYQDLFDGMRSGYQKAAAIVGETCIDLCIGGHTVRLQMAGARCRDAVSPAYAHLTRTEAAQEPDLTILVWETRGNGVKPPHPDWSKAQISVKGTIKEYSDQGQYASYIWGVGAAQVLSTSDKLAVYWIDDAEEIPYWERSFPFRQILSWWFGPLALQPVHAACVAWGDQGILMPGISGSGKSTTSLKLSLLGFDLLGDDYVLLDTTREPKVWSLFRSAKLSDGSLKLLPELGGHARRYRPLDEKLTVFWPPPEAGRMREAVDLAAIVLPKVTKAARTTLEPASPGEVVLSLAPTTINHLDVPAPKVLSMARDLSGRLPAYRLLLGSDFERSAEILKDVLRS